jgi:hypothetical protein
MRNSLLKRMKEVFKPKTANRRRLASSQVVAVFHGKGEPITNPWAKKDAIANGRSIVGVFQERIFHVAHMSFNPYGPSWMEVHRKTDDQYFLKLVPGSLPITADRHQHFAELDGIELLDRSLQWTVQWYLTSTNQKHVRMFVPGDQHLLPVPASARVQFWPRVRGMCAADALLDDDGEDADEEALPLEDEAEPDDPDDQPADDDADVDEVLGDTSEDEPEDPHDVSAALAKVRLPNGSSIGFYRDGRFEAVCRHVNHLPKGRCRLTRTSYGTGDDTCPAQGRPLGLLASWCLSQDA